MSAESHPSERPLFSVVVLARNEAHASRLPRLLESLRPFLACGGEVLLADTGSTDKTMQVAEKAGATVVSFGDKFSCTLTEVEIEKASEVFERMNWRDLPTEDLQRPFLKFGPARAAAGEACSKADFVLHLDCGDVVETMDIQAINQLLEKNPRAAVKTQHVLGNGCVDGTEFLSPSTRFYDRRAWTYTGFAHEFVKARSAPNLQEVTLSLEQLQVRYTRRPTKRAYIPALISQVVLQPLVFRWHYYLTRELYYAKRWGMVARITPNVFAICGSAGWKEERSQLWCFAGESHVMLKDHKAAISCFCNGLAENPSRREPYVRMAYVFLSNKQYAAAGAFAEAAACVPKSNGLYENNRNYTVIPSDIAYCSHYWQGHTEQSYRHWLRCVHTEPSNERYQRDRSFFPLVKDQDQSEAAAAITPVPACDLGRERIRLALNDDMLDMAWELNNLQPTSYQAQLEKHAVSFLTENSHTAPAEAVCVSNGTVALEMVYRLFQTLAENRLCAAGLPPAPKFVVFAPAYTFRATYSAAQWLGIDVQLIDLMAGDDRSFVLTAEGVAASLRDAVERLVCKPQHILCVAVTSLFGQVPDLHGIRAVVDEFNLVHELADVRLVEDAAQSLGSEGSVGHADVDLSTVSFYPSKPIGTYGEGGLIVSSQRSDPSWIPMIRAMSNHARGGEPWGVAVGTNARMGAIESCVVIRKLAHALTLRTERFRVASVYVDLFQKSESALVNNRMQVMSLGDGLWMISQFAVVFSSEAECACALASLRAARVDARNHYSDELLKVDGGGLMFPESIQRAKRTLCLPLFPFMTLKEQCAVVKALETSSTQ